MKDPYLHYFKTDQETIKLPSKLNDPFELDPPEISKIAAQELQDYIINNPNIWNHDFGLEEASSKSGKGKMFGVLVVITPDQQLAYLSAYSGKFADESKLNRFVPSLFDDSTDDYFINKGMEKLTQYGLQIKALNNQASKENLSLIVALKQKRKQKSIQLQQQLFDNYNFLNVEKQIKNVCSIFINTEHKIPPSGSGECAAPKLLQYAFQNNLKPIALAEFWWGKSPKSGERQHLNYYPSCNDKCKPILAYMLS